MELAICIFAIFGFLIWLFWVAVLKDDDNSHHGPRTL